jgi:hypothetical protein
MENMEKVTWRIWNSDGIGRSLLIGGLLFYVPILNLLLLGYYGRWARQLILQQGMELPEWRDGRAILDELVRVLVPAIVWIFIPSLLAGLLVWAFSGLFGLLYLGIFANTLAWTPLAIVALFSPPAMVAALMRLYKSWSLRECLDIHHIIQAVIRNFRECLFPLFQFYGIVALGWPLIGFAAFLATLPLLAQLILVLRDAAGDLKS